MDYLTVNGCATATYEIQHSVFICNVKGVESFEEGMAFVKEISKKYSDATHNCYALITNDGQQKFSDDSEPQGTAGMPILQVLKKNNLTNTVAVTTRYFGGIKLGAGGLVASYTKSCVDALKNAEIVNVRFCDELEINSSYSEYKKIISCINSFGKVVSTDFSDGVKQVCAVPIQNTDTLLKKLNELTSGKISFCKTRQFHCKF